MSYLSQHTLRISDPIYNTVIHYFNFRKEEDYCKALKSLFGIERQLDGGIGGCFEEFAPSDSQPFDTILCIWTAGKSTEFVAHEILHTVFNVLNRAGLKLSDETDEAFAYYTEYLMREISNFNKGKSQKPKAE